MDNPETLWTSDTQDSGRIHTQKKTKKNPKTQYRKLKRWTTRILSTTGDASYHIIKSLQQNKSYVKQIDDSVCTINVIVTDSVTKSRLQFSILNYPHFDSNIPTAPVYGAYTSQLKRYARACSLYSDFSQRHHHTSSKLFKDFSHLAEMYHLRTDDERVVVTIRFWFKVDNCFSIMAYDGLVYYLLFR